MQMIYFHSDTIGRGRGGVTIGYSIRLACRNLGDRIRATTDLNRKKQVVSAPLQYARQQVLVSWVLGDYYYQRISLVTVGVAR